MPETATPAERRQNKLTKVTAEKLYGSYWMLTSLNRKDGQFICYCCDAPATGRSSMNIWGGIHDFPSCDACHAKIDGCRADDIPDYRKKD